jgi:hypothetical protein
MCIFVLALTFLAGMSQRATAQETTGANLKGLTGVAVHVDTSLSLSPTPAMTQLESDITGRLRDEGITVIPAQAPRSYGTQGFVWARVWVVRAAPGANRSIVHTKVTMDGSVTLAGSNDRGEAITWETERLGIVPTTDTNARVRDDLNFLVDDFSKAYRAANPR